MSDEACADGCQRGHGGRCYAIRTGHRRFCELIALGWEDYARLVDERTNGDVEQPSEAERARLRRAAKPRVPLGTRAKPGGG